MGTNYYWTPGKCINPCAHCSGADDIHIGKSSGGWCFSLHVYPDDGVKTLSDWEERFWRDGSRIKNEYGEPVMPHGMVAIITEREWPRGSVPPQYVSWDQFHEFNESMDGPDGLLRHKIMHGCIGHGEGTWDYFTGDFC